MNAPWKKLVATIAVILISSAAVRSLRTPTEADHYLDYDDEALTCLASAAQSKGHATIEIEPLSSRLTIPKKLTIKGSPYEIGQTIGLVGKQSKARLPLRIDANRKLNEELVELYREIYPEYLDIIHGAADVYGKTSDEVDIRLFESDFATPLWCNLLGYNKFYALTDFSTHGDPAAHHHCSAASYWSDGRHLVGRNFDHASDRPHYFVRLEIDGCHRVIGNTLYDITGEVDDGMNEHGLALCVASNNDGRFAVKEPYPNEPAIVMWHMMQIVLLKCATVDEALDLLRRVRVWFPEENNHWLLADASGKSVVVEWTPGDLKMVVFDRPGPYELMTNAAWMEGENYLVKNCRRFGKAQPLLEEGVTDCQGMLAVMEAMRIKAGPGRSLWTSVMDLNSRKMAVRYFKEFQRDYEFGF